MSKPPAFSPPSAEPHQESHGPSRPRRRYTRRKKIEILAELDRCRDGVETDAVLAREGLHGSQISLWRKGIARAPNTPHERKERKARVEPAQRAVELAEENARLRRELSRVLKAMALLARNKVPAVLLAVVTLFALACGDDEESTDPSDAPWVIPFADGSAEDDRPDSAARVPHSDADPDLSADSPRDDADAEMAPPLDGDLDAGIEVSRADASVQAGDSGSDAGRSDGGLDAGTHDAAVQGGLDATVGDAGHEAGAPDASTHDAGHDAGVDAGKSDASTGVPDGGPSVPATFSEVYAILQQNCLDCHVSSGQGYLLDMSTKALAYQELVGGPGMGAAEFPACAGMGLRRVVASFPDQSLLVRKLADTAGCGDMMPPSGPLNVATQARIRSWISAGAANN